MAMKGAFFTFTSILIGAMIIFILVLQLQADTDRDQAIQVRILSLDGFVDDEIADFSRAIRISGMRGLISLSEEVILSGDVLSDVNSSMNEIMVNGTIRGREPILMQESSISFWEGKVLEIADDINVNFFTNIHSINVYHDDPWSVVVDVDATLNFVDSSGLASFEVRDNFVERISILGIEDPTFSINSQGIITSFVNVSPYSEFVSGNDTSNLLDHTLSGYYIANLDSPSFLMRLEGNYSSSAYGIESLVDVSEFEENLLPTFSRSVVDHVYFGNGGPSSGVLGMPSWFRLDSEHREVYDVD